MFGGGGGGRKRRASPALCYDSDGANVVEVPMVYGAGSVNCSSRVELFRMDVAPRKVPRVCYSSDDDSPQAPPRSRGSRPARPAKTDDRRLQAPRAACTAEENRQLVEIIEYYLTSIQVNPYNGSVPVERIQNVVRDKHMDLYAKVVGSGRNTWGKFLDRNADVLRVVADGEKKRLCLRSQQNWEEGDQLEAQERREREAYLLSALFQFFQRRGSNSCKVDDFMEGYASLPIHCGLSKIPDLPARGDFVRFVKRHPYNFSYNPQGLEVVLKSDAWPPPKEP